MKETTIPDSRKEKLSHKCANFMDIHKVFRRTFVCIFVYLCWDMNFWLQRMIETKVLEGGYFVEVYVGAMVGGFVAIVTAYATAGQNKKE